MIPRSKAQQRKIAETIRDHHLSFLAEVLGKDAIPADDYTRLLASKKINRIPLFPVDALTAATVLGTVTARGQNPSPSSFWSHEVHRQLTDAEKEAIQVAKDRVKQYVQALTNRLTETAVRKLSADGARAASRFKRLVWAKLDGAQTGQAARDIAASFREFAQSAQREWLRLVVTEIHNAIQEGRAQVFASSTDLIHDGDVRVFKRVTEDTCCEFCRHLYMNGNVPKVFLLSDLASNGTNVGRRGRKAVLTGAASTDVDWRPVLGAVHPWCRCTLQALPPNYGFDSSGNVVAGKEPIIYRANQHE